MLFLQLYLRLLRLLQHLMVQLVLLQLVLQLRLLLLLLLLHLPLPILVLMVALPMLLYLIPLGLVHLLLCLQLILTPPMQFILIYLVLQRGLVCQYRMESVVFLKCSWAIRVLIIRF